MDGLSLLACPIDWIATSKACEGTCGEPQHLPSSTAQIWAIFFTHRKLSGVCLLSCWIRGSSKRQKARWRLIPHAYGGQFGERGIVEILKKHPSPFIRLNGITHKFRGIRTARRNFRISGERKGKDRQKKDKSLIGGRGISPGENTLSRKSIYMFYCIFELKWVMAQTIKEAHMKWSLWRDETIKRI
ncbi:hypothetical protein H5410_055467 [Solanum commersonii]|uniref:Uncharacterized protein n=1 Tax=Solanum commersonii TaxID=4109 RepID=A0A9J5WIT4_SOLCO|nr:hypothetical protein H5410_055467 [Solanum commersonii]